MGIHYMSGMALQNEYVRYVPIPIDELHSPFDEQHMKEYEKTRIIGAKEDCGCYETQRQDEHEHYTTYTTSYHNCPEHYAIHLAGEENKHIRYMEEQIKRDTCADILLALAKKKQGSIWP